MRRVVVVLVLVLVNTIYKTFPIRLKKIKRWKRKAKEESDEKKRIVEVTIYTRTIYMRRWDGMRKGSNENCGGKKRWKRNKNIGETNEKRREKGKANYKIFSKRKKNYIESGEKRYKLRRRR